MTTDSLDDLISRVFNLSVLVSAAAIVLISRSTDLDILLSLLPLLFVLGVAIGAYQSQERHTPMLYKVASIGSLCLLISAALIRRPESTYPGLWAGFGLQPTATAIAMAITAVFGPADRELLISRKSMRVLVFIILPLVAIAPRLTLFIQPPNGLINLGDTSYHVLDEMLAPLSGLLAYGDYTPQYSGTLGWLLVPLSTLPVTGDQMMLATIILVNLLNLMVPLLVVAIARLAFPEFRRVLMFSAFVAIWTVCGSDLGYSVQIREFAHFGRYTASLFAMWLVLLAILADNKRHGWKQAFIAGLGLAYAALNNVDHGLTLSISSVIGVLLLFALACVSKRLVILLGIGFLTVVLAYLAVLTSFDQQFTVVSYLGLRSDALQGNVYGTTQQVSPFGPNLLVVATPVALVAIAFRYIIRRKEGIPPPQVMFLMISTALWSFSLFIKLVLAAGGNVVGLPAYFVTAFLGCVVLVGLGQPSRRGGRFFGKGVALPLVFLLSLSVGSIYPSTNVRVMDELKRITGRYVNTIDWSSTPGRNSDGWSRKGLAIEKNFLSEVESRATQYEDAGLSVGYFGVYGNTVELITGVQNLTGLAGPESMRFGIGQQELACRPVDRAGVKVIVVYDSIFPCRGYVKSDLLSDEILSVFQRVP
jgi:hypothetical protein